MTYRERFRPDMHRIQGKSATVILVLSTRILHEGLKSADRHPTRIVLRKWHLDRVRMIVGVRSIDGFHKTRKAPCRPLRDLLERDPNMSDRIFKKKRRFLPLSSRFWSEKASPFSPGSAFEAKLSASVPSLCPSCDSPLFHLRSQPILDILKSRAISLANPFPEKSTP